MAGSPETGLGWKLRSPDSNHKTTECLGCPVELMQEKIHIDSR